MCFIHVCWCIKVFGRQSVYTSIHQVFIVFGPLLMVLHYTSAKHVIFAIKWDLFPQNERQVAKFRLKVIGGFIVFRLLSFKMIYNMPGLLPYLQSKTHYFLEKFLCFLLIFEMFNEPYLLYFPGDLSLILWEQISNVNAWYLEENIMG